jgi:hypothetical protein
MSFKKANLLIIGAAFIFGSCTLRQTPPSSQPFNMSNTDLSCMDSLSDTMNRYKNGQTNDADVNAAWDCASKSLTLFTQRVVGDTPGQYTSVELRNFLQTYYIHKITLTDDLLDSVGLLKTLIVGGAPEEISLTEIQEIQQIFETLRGISLAMRPYMPVASTGIMGLPWKSISSQQLDAFNQVLMSAAAQIGTIFDDVGNAYTFTQFSHFIETIEGCYPPGQGLDVIASLELLKTRIPLLASLKSTLINPSGDYISDGSDWKALWSSAGRWAAMIVKVGWFLNPDRSNAAGSSDPLFPNNALITGKNLVFINELYTELVDLLSAAIARHSPDVITFAEFNALIDQFKDSDFTVNKASIQATIPPLIRRFIGGNDFTTDGREAVGLTAGSLNHLSALFHNWYEGQRVIEELVKRLANSADNRGEDILQSKILTSPIARSFWSEVLNETNSMWNDNSVIAARRLQFMIGDIQPLFFLDSPYEIVFPLNQSRQAFSFQDLSTKNWMQVAAISMIQGYAEYDAGEDHSLPPKRSIWQSSPGVSGAEFQNVYNDLSPLGIQLKIFDPNDKKAAANRFKESDSFTYKSNGDGYMSTDEATTYLGFALSTVHKANRVHDSLAAKCPSKAGADIYGRALIEPVCYRRDFFEDADTYWAPMKTGIEFYQGLSSDSQANYQKLLEIAARKGGYQPTTWMNSDDTEGFVGSLQYVEAIYSRYDLNRDGYLTSNEANIAFPVFKRVLEQFSAANGTTISDSVAKTVFTFMLAKGEVPDTQCHKFASEAELALWMAQRMLPFLSNFKADRLRVVEIFGALGESSISNSCN